MWDYSLIFPSALMMLTLLVFYFSRARAPLRMNRRFLVLLVVELAVLVSDVVATRIDETYALHDPATLYVANSAFFLFFVLRIYLFFRFAMSIAFADARVLPGRLLWVAALPFVVIELLCLTSFATGAIFSVQDGAYARGPWYPLLNFAYCLYEAIGIALVCWRRPHLRRQDLVCAVAYNLVLFVGTFIRIVMPRLLVMDTFCMVAITIIYLGFLNPDLYLSGYGTTFNMRCFRLLLTEWSNERDRHLLGFSLQNYNHERSIVGSQQMDAAIALIGEFLHDTFADEVVFYLRGGRFALMGAGSAAGEDIAAAIRQRFADSWHLRTVDLRFGVGIAQVDGLGQMANADRTMNDLVIALDNVRHSTARSDDPDNPIDVRQVGRQVDVLRQLEWALSRNEVEVYLQPLVNSATSRIEGAESLARIHDDEGGIISPELFIPIAEKSGLIVELGLQVLRKTCEFVQTHDLDELGLRWISVNLSPIQCMQQDVATQFLQTLEAYGVDSGVIRLEITEQSMIDFEQMREPIAGLEREGFRFAMDDYGTGYSNLTNVKRYPFSSVKLDMEVVWDYFRDRDELLPAIVRGFKSLGLSVTAEGIETREMADALAGIGCDYLQGFYFSKPVPSSEFARLLA